MRNTSFSTSDNFEKIAHDAVAGLTAAALTLKLIGENELANAIASKSLELVDRAIALGAE